MHATFYKSAADKLVEVASADAAVAARGDFLFPAAFLYRHYLELMLKNLVGGGRAARKLTVNDRVLEEHNLHKLWNKAKELLDTFCSAEDEPAVRFAESVVLGYHTVDESSCNFRYPVQKDGKPPLEALPPSGRLADQLRGLNLSGLQSDIEKTHQLFDNASDWLNALFDGLIDDDAGP